MHRMRTTVSLVTAATLLAAAPATAGTPFTLGTTTNGNDKFSVAMNDADGTAYVAWQTSATQVAFCRLPRGARACAATATIGAPSDVEQPWLLRNAGSGELTLVDTRYVAGNVRIWRSVDDGATWTGPTAVSDANPGTDARRPLRLDGGFVLTPSTNSGRRMDRWALDGSEAATDTSAMLGDGGVPFLVYDLAVARAGAPGLVAVANNLDNAYVWTLPDQAGADLVGNWVGPTLLGAGEKDTDVVSGGGQTYAFSRTGGTVRVRKLVGGSFGAPVATVPFTGSLSRSDASEDGGDSVRAGALGGAVYAMVSSDGGATYALRVVAAESGTFPDVGIDDSGQGLVVYKGEGNVLRAADLTPAVPATTPTPVTPSPTPTPTTPTFVPGGPSGLPSSASGSSNGGSFTVSGPRTCVPRGGRFTATLTVRKQKRKGNLFVKVTKVDFSIDGRILRTDRKAPFRQTLTATATAAKGSTITMRARAFIKVRKTKKVPKKSVSLKIRICS